MSLARKAILLSMLPFSLATSCTTTSSEKVDKEGSQQLTKAEKQIIAEMKAEIEIGRNIAGRMLQFFGVYDDTGALKYLNRVGNYVASFSDDPERKYMFQILDTNMVNAFACPGGYILFTLGALKLLKNEAELSSVLGHEIAHVAKRHMYDTLTSMDTEEIVKTAQQAKDIRSIPPSVRVRKRPEPDDSKTGSVLARYLGQATGVNILQVAKAGMTVMMEKGLDKELEFEADQLGVKYAIRAGYDPQSLTGLLDRLRKRAAKVNIKVLSKTHPSFSDRINGMKNVMDAMNAKDIVGAKGAKRFLKVKSLIIKKSNKI